MKTRFREEIYKLRLHGVIRRVWRPAELQVQLTGQFAVGTFSANPNNSSVSRYGDWIGSNVKRGVTPWAWRVDRGEYELIVDPDDEDAEHYSQMRLALGRVAEQLEPGTVAAEISHQEVRRAIRRVIPVGAGGGSDLVARGVPAHTIDRPAGNFGSAGRTEQGARTVTGVEDVGTFGRADRRAIPVALSESERVVIDGLNTAEKAEWIVRRYIAETREGPMIIREARIGEDLTILEDGQTYTVEVRGTENSTVEWGQFKVSEQKSHDSLESGASLIYYVVDVSSSSPVIRVLKHGRDFTLEPEPVWAAKPVSAVDVRYPLRGMPFKYVQPFDGVDLDEWGADN